MAIPRNSFMEEGGAPKQAEQAPPDNQNPADIIRELGLITMGNNFKSDIQYISIIGSIEGHTVLPAENKTTKYEHLIPQLIMVEENPEIKGLLTVLNTVGGDVEAGLAIAELISTISKPTVSIVLGGGHSIGIPLAAASDYSFICETATMTLHPIRTSGLVITAQSTFDQLKKIQDRVVDFIVSHSKADRSEVMKRMNCTDNMANDVGTVLFGNEAVELGIIDEVGGLSQALGKLREMIENK